MNYRKFTGGTLLSCALLLAASIPTSLISSPSRGDARVSVAADSGKKVASAAAQNALNSLEQATPGRVTAQVSRTTGHYTFVSAADRGPLVADDAKAAAPQRARAFLAAHGALLGINDPERAALSKGGVPPNGSDLQTLRTDTDKIGMTHVRFTQSYKGIPVHGAQVIVHMNGEGITGVNGDFVPDVALSTIPELSADAASQLALISARKAAAGEDLKIAKSELAVYPVGLLEGRPVVSRLAYGVEISGDHSSEQVWVDAQNGNVLARIPRHHTALNRVIYSPQYRKENPELFVQRREGDGPHPTPFVNHLYDFAGQTYNFYASAFGRDSYDALGSTMISVYLINEQCPNAYWNGESTNYCPAFDADDIVSHEWSHGYTQFTHGLIYAYQSGALNESYSDIFGEAVDLLNGADGIGGSNNDKPFPEGQRWLLGEDLGEAAQEELLRDMYDPDRLGDPGKLSSVNYACGNSDSGGVHTNSGVPNHAFALIVDGTQYKAEIDTEEFKQPAGTYNGQTVTGIGLVKASAIYYRAQTVYHTPTTTFAQHDTAIQKSCSDLIGAPLNNLSTNDPNGTAAAEVISAADCGEIAKAMLAVEMSLPPPCNTGPVLNDEPASLCPGATAFFSEDWESGEDGWTKTSMGYATGVVDWEQQPSKNNRRFFKLTTDPIVNRALPDGRSGTAIFADDPKLNEEGGGTCVPGGDYSGSHTLDSPSIKVPDGATEPLLVFDHWIATEVGVDGGQVEISNDNGASWTLIPKSAYVYNGPNNVFNQPAPLGNNTNPNPSEDAWTGFNIGIPQVGSWGTTVANLAGIVQPGDTMKIRFIWSQDGCNGVEGWYIDNIKVVTCPLLEVPTLTAGSDYENPDADGRFTLNWTRPAGAVGPDLLQESQNSCGPVIADNAEAGMTKWTTSTSGTGARPWKTDSTKPKHTSNTFNVQAVNGITNAESYLTYKDPIAIPSGGQTFLNFKDWDLNEGDDNVFVDVSEDDGTTWVPVYLHNRSETGTGPVAFANEPLFQRSVNLANHAGKTIRLRFRYSLGPDDRPASVPLGWYVDDIELVKEDWTDVASTPGTSLQQRKAGGTSCYRVRTTYSLEGQSVASPFSNIQRIDVAATVPGAARLQNIAARARVQTGDDVLFGGFIIRDAPKRVIIRAIGPSMQSGGAAVPGRMSDPVLQLHQEGNPVPIATNDDWQTNAAEVQGTNLAPTDAREPAIVATLNPGSYTAIMSGKSGEVGLGVVEVYDLDSGAASTLRNLAARAFVESDDNVLIGGFIAGPTGSGTTRVVVRAIGPSLKSQIPQALDDTTLEVVDANGSPTTNDDWAQSGNAAEIQQAGLAPNDPRESAVLLPGLAAGPHTAIVRGKGQPRGVGLVEIYDIQ